MAAESGGASLRRVAVSRGPGDDSTRPTGGTERTAVLVTGMHRSGTSALARTLSLLGAALPDDLVAPNEGNPRGHWEPRGMVDLNDRMLADSGSDLYGIGDVAPDWFGSASASAFAAEAACLVERSFRDETLIVLKDPRTAVLAPIWNQALVECGYRVVHVLPLRHPVDVAESLRRRHLKAFPYDAWAQPRGEVLWLRYTLAAVRGSRGHPRVFLRYGALLDDWRREVRRIGRELDIAWPRLGTAGEAEVDAFLHGNDQAEGHHPAIGTDPDEFNGLDLVRLASACFAELVTRGDVGPWVDALHAEFSQRIGGVRDLVTMFEALYPLVWRYYEAAEEAGQRRDVALAEEARSRETGQQTWAALTRSNTDKLRLQQDLGSRDRQVVSLQGEVSRLEGLLTADERRDGLADQITRLNEAVTAAEAERAELAAELHRITEAAWRERMEGETRIAALQASTSWRVTAPLRALSRTVRRRP